MSAKHTPGPWTVQEREYSFRVVDCRALKFDNSRLCDVQHWSGATRGPDREESRANAHLIAAAPELLKVLRMARAKIAADLQVMVMSHTGPDGLIDDAEVVLLIEAEQDLVNQIDEVIAKATGEQA